MPSMAISSSAGYQHMSGDSAFPYVDGSDPYLVNFVQINDFAGADSTPGRRATTTTSPSWAFPA